MIQSQEILNSEKYIFSDTPFKLLMQKRIIKVLLVCSNYDAFMLEEDGRIEELLFEEYASLNLRYPPFFIHVTTIEDALSLQEKGEIDLVITMFNSEGIDVFLLAEQLKKQSPEIPIVALTHFSHNNAIRYESLGDTLIDYVFSWLGSADLLLAIIKLVEDELNVENDVENVGVQVILLVEDTVWFYSSYLSTIYSVMYSQTQAFKNDGLNKHKKNMLLRGRPKVLLANNLEDAQAIVDKYGNNLLGVITDLSFPFNGEQKSRAGLQLAKYVREQNKSVPILLQSMNEAEDLVAPLIGVSFLSKRSIDLPLKIKQYFSQCLAFGDFEFRTHDGGEVIARASNLKDFQNTIATVSQHSLAYHSRRNNFSRWLKARAQFQLAEMLEPLNANDFDDIEMFRKFLVNALSLYRLQMHRTGVAHYNHDTYDHYVHFSRSGTGSMGGKARGLAFADALLHKYSLVSRYKNVLVSVPRSLVLCSSHFDEFIRINNLYETAFHGSEEQLILSFKDAIVPESLVRVLKQFVKSIRRPVAVRSSSVLEDSNYCSFAGVYHTQMVFYNQASENRNAFFEAICLAIKSVYASVYVQSSKDFFAATSSLVDEEKMSILLQEVCGEFDGEMYYPTCSGVATSYNYYPLPPETHEGGIAELAIGLGSYIVDGASSVRFSPEMPQRALHLNDLNYALQHNQRKVHVLKYNENVGFMNAGVESVRLRSLLKRKDVLQMTSAYDIQNEVLREGVHSEGTRVVTFSQALQYESYPLSQIVNDILTIGAKEMNCPVEIEFAIQLPIDGAKELISFQLLQLRPMTTSYGHGKVNITDEVRQEALVYSKSAMGNGVVEGVQDILFLSEDVLQKYSGRELVDIVKQFNSDMLTQKKKYILLGPGRWGTSDPALGIPVQWADVCAAKVIGEMCPEGLNVEMSNGSHFFHNLVNLGVHYISISDSLTNENWSGNFLKKDQIASGVHKITGDFCVMTDGEKGKSIIIKRKQ